MHDELAQPSRHLLVGEQDAWAALNTVATGECRGLPAHTAAVGVLRQALTDYQSLRNAI